MRLRRRAVLRQTLQPAPSFTAHRVQLPDGTWSKDESGDDAFEALSTRVVLETAGGSLRGKRVLDVGCLEGGYTIAFAQLGAREAVGLEIRETNLERCRYLQRMLRIKGVRFLQADAKAVSVEELGLFDIVFAQGLLYHLDDPYDFLARCARLTRDFALIETHVAAVDAWAHGCSDRLIGREWGGFQYVGREYAEYPATASSEEIEGLSWASFGNPTSFWLTQESLVRMLVDVGFPFVSKVFVPRGYRCGEGCSWECRIMLVARKSLAAARPGSWAGAQKAAFTDFAA